MSCASRHAFDVRAKANKSCGHALDPKLVRPAVSEGMCPSCKVPLEPCDHRACNCCGWIWTDNVLVSFDSIVGSI